MSKNKMRLKKCGIVFFAICFYFHGLSQQVSELQNGVKGLWTQNTFAKDLLNGLQAQWVWLPESIENDVMLARRTFNFSQKPQASKLRITASSKYELYVNGIYVCQGPARSAPHHQSFDILNVSSLLLQGKNTIAVKVHYQQGTKSYHLNGRAGLLVQLDVEGVDTNKTIISDKNWKVLPDLSWDNNAPAINRFQLMVNDRVDLNYRIIGYETSNFDDSNWYQAKPLLRNSGWPSPKKNEKARSLTTPWTSLIPRDIPYLNEVDIPAIKLIEAKEIPITDIEKASVALTGIVQKDIHNSFKKFINDKAPLLIQSSESEKIWFLLFDFGKVINGMPKLEIKGSKNTKVSILSAPFIVGNIFTHHIVASNFEDDLILSGKKDIWQAMYFKPTRYMAVIVKGNPVEIYNLGIHQLEYPFELKGSITTPDTPWIEDFWKASVKTINTCTTDAFTDNYRERRQYAQTGYYASKGNYFTYGDTALQRRYLIQIAQEQEAGGLMPAYAPLTGDDYMVILDSNCLWIRSLHDYLLYSGDFNTVNKLLPSAKKLMNLLHSYTNDLGLINNPPYAYWLDHALNDRQGANLCLNGHYLGALKDFSQLLEWIGDKDEILYKDRAELIIKTIKTYFWDAEKQLFSDALIDGKRSKMFSEHANAMALAEGIATPEQARAIAKILLAKDNHNYIKRENGMTMVTPAMSYALHKGLADYGYAEASLNMLYDRFKKMLSTQTNGTLWEEWWLNGTGRDGKFQERTRSDAQTESAFPPALFTNYVLGVQVTKPGMKEIHVEKPKFDLSRVEGKVPTPQGLLYINWNIGDNSRLRLEVPKDVKINVDIESLTLGSNKEIYVNGEKVKKAKRIKLSRGKHTISF